MTVASPWEFVFNVAYHGFVFAAVLHFVAFGFGFMSRMVVEWVK